MTERLFTEDDLLTENFAEFETPTTTPEPGDTTMTRAQEEDPGPADGQDAEQSTGAEVVNLDKARAEKPKGIKRLAENHRARCAADIQPRDIDWFWKPYLPRGMLSLLDGDPGCGKSFITLALAAALSTGRPFPSATGRPGKPRSSLICSAEGCPKNPGNPPVWVRGPSYSEESPAGPNQTLNRKGHDDEHV